MFHAISGWLTRHARQNREELARDHEFAALNGWQARQIHSGTWAYRDPRFTQLAALRAARTLAPARPTWAQAAITGRIATLALLAAHDERREGRCS